MDDLIQKTKVVEKNGMHIATEIAERTVWDALAIENPTHAVISAPNEADAEEKSSAQIEDIKKYVNQDTVLLDLGCGYGRVAQYLLPKKRLKRYVGVDSSVEMLELFKERYHKTPAEQSTPLTLVGADIHTLPLKDNSVDVITVCAVFLHNHKSIVQRSMEEVKRVLRPGGTLLVYSSFPRSWTLMGLQGHLYQGLLNILGRPMKNGPVRYYSKREITHMLADFTEVTYQGHGFAVLPKTIIILPGFLERLYRNGIANPVNHLLERITPKKLRPYFAVHHDVIATR